jgi:hypothetical protein
MVLVDGVGEPYQYLVDSGRTIIAGGTLRDWAPGCGGPTMRGRSAWQSDAPNHINSSLRRPGHSTPAVPPKSWYFSSLSIGLRAPKPVNFDRESLVRCTARKLITPPLCSHAACSISSSRFTGDLFRRSFMPFNLASLRH